MANSNRNGARPSTTPPPNRIWRAPSPLAALLLACAAAALIPAARAANGVLSADSLRGPVKWSANSMSLDYQNHQIVLRGAVKIEQGDISVEADQAEASGLDAQDSRWVFTGKVHVHAEGQGELHSDRSVVQFAHGNVTQVTVTGAPAQFEQANIPGGGHAQGHANTIDYDVAAALVRLSGDAWLSDGRSEITYPQITYNVRDKSLQAEGGRGHSVVAPRSLKDTSRQDSSKK